MGVREQQRSRAAPAQRIAGMPLAMHAAAGLQRLRRCTATSQPITRTGTHSRRTAPAPPAQPPLTLLRALLGQRGIQRLPLLLRQEGGRGPVGHVAGLPHAAAPGADGQLDTLRGGRAAGAAVGTSSARRRRCGRRGRAAACRGRWRRPGSRPRSPCPVAGRQRAGPRHQSRGSGGGRATGAGTGRGHDPRAPRRHGLALAGWRAAPGAPAVSHQMMQHSRGFSGRGAPATLSAEPTGRCRTVSQVPGGRWSAGRVLLVRGVVRACRSGAVIGDGRVCVGFRNTRAAILAAPQPEHPCPHASRSCGANQPPH